MMNLQRCRYVGRVFRQSSVSETPCCVWVTKLTVMTTSDSGSRQHPPPSAWLSTPFVFRAIIYNAKLKFETSERPILLISVCVCVCAEWPGKHQFHPFYFIWQYKPKVTQAETPRVTAQQHKHVMEDRMKPSVGHMHHDGMTQGTFNTVRYNNRSLYDTFTPITELLYILQHSQIHGWTAAFKTVSEHWICQRKV